MAKNYKQREYKVYGHDRGRKAVPRYLFTVKALDAKAAKGRARYRVKGAKVIDRLKRVNSPPYLVNRVDIEEVSRDG